MNEKNRKTMKMKKKKKKKNNERAIVNCCNQRDQHDL